MADDELFYLQPGFDVSTLTVPKLRSILVSHNVSYPSSAKKQDLIDILQQNVLPRAKKLLSAQARIRRTSHGIEDVPSSQDNEDDEAELMPPPPAPKTPRSRKSRTNLQSEDETPRTVRTSRTPSTRRTVKKPRELDTEGSERVTGSTRRARQRSTDVKITEPTYSRRSLAAEVSPFSDDNPFQSGSSPAIEQRSASKPRKSDVRKSTSKKRSPVTIKSETYEIPVSSLGVDRAGVETTEEFTADEVVDLQQELQSNKQLARVRNSVLRQKQPTSTTAKVTPVAILVTVFGLLGGWYRQEKINIGYCGVGEPNWSLAQNTHIPAWAHENLQPSCEPCPSHAICSTNMQVECEHNFVLKSHPLSVNGLVPLPPTCEPDSEKEKIVKAVGDRAIEVLRERRADYECGQPLSTETSESETSTVADSTRLEISEETLKRMVSKKRRKSVSDEEFDGWFDDAMKDIRQRDEVETTEDGSQTLYSSTSLAKLPLTCATRRFVLRTVARFKIPIFIVSCILSGLAYLYHRYLAYTQAKLQTPSLVAMTLDRLATQAALKEDGRLQEGFISVAQLRDDVLRNVFSVRERENVWERVRKIVEQNSNVRAATREGARTGEWSRVWEWIGPVDLAPGLTGRNSGLIQNSESPPTQGQEVRKWDEGRAIY